MLIYSKEIMSKIGMGVIYTNDCNTTIAIPTKKYKRLVLKSYYDKYHGLENPKYLDIVTFINKENLPIYEIQEKCLKKIKVKLKNRIY